MSILFAGLLQLSFLVLTLTTGILGGAPLLILYRTHPRSVVFALQLITFAAIIAAKAPLLALTVLCMNFMIWSYLSLEKRRLHERAIISVLLSAGIYIVSVYAWVRYQMHLDIWTWLTDQFNFYIEQSQHLLGNITVDAKVIIYQVPSFVITAFALNLWLAALIDSKAQKKLGHIRSELEIKNFKAPEYLIWIAICALLFSFVKTPVPGIQEAALNILNVALLLYFFQGLSLVSYTMEIFSFGALLKIIVYFIFIAQLLLPVCLGILDYWLNFRNKISKRRVG